MQTAHILSESYQASPKNIPGAPGTQTFRVVFPREGRFNLKFAYRRLWEASSLPPAQTTNLVVQVAPAIGSRSVMEKIFNLPSTPPALTVPQPEDEPPHSRIPLRTTR